jgi:hypothetical protein
MRSRLLVALMTTAFAAAAEDGRSREMQWNAAP